MTLRPRLPPEELPLLRCLGDGLPQLLGLHTEFARMNGPVFVPLAHDEGRLCVQQKSEHGPDLPFWRLG